MIGHYLYLKAWAKHFKNTAPIKKPKDKGYFFRGEHLYLKSLKRKKY